MRIYFTKDSVISRIAGGIILASAIFFAWSESTSSGILLESYAAKTIEFARDTFGIFPTFAIWFAASLPIASAVGIILLFLKTSNVARRIVFVAIMVPAAAPIYYLLLFKIPVPLPSIYVFAIDSIVPLGVRDSMPLALLLPFLHWHVALWGLISLVVFPQINPISSEAGPNNSFKRTGPDGPAA
jgi:hypothetical protein